MKFNRRILIKLLATSCATTVLSIGAANAQTATEDSGSSPAAKISASTAAAPAEDTGSSQAAEIIVTGSRIGAPNAKSISPTIVIGGGDLAKLSPQNVADGLRFVPQFRGSFSTNAPFPSPTILPGINAVNLRGLGLNETLVLMNGHRVAPTNNKGVIDLNSLPQQLISRVDIVTGGVSAAYGSDAVAGVVNFILDENFKGIKGSVSHGLSSHSDMSAWNANLAAGADFAQGRGHVLLSGEYSTRDPMEIGAAGRGWYTKNRGIVPAPGVPQRHVFDSGVTNSNGAPGGLITSGPLRGTTFTDAGSPTVFHYGDVVGPAFQHGGDGILNPSILPSGIKRKSGYGRISYEFSDNVRAYAGISYNETHTRSGGAQSGYPYFVGQYQLTIFSGNPFLPPDTQAGMITNGLASIPLGKLVTTNPTYSDVRNKALRVEAGIEGKIGNSWSYDLYYSHARSRQRLEQGNDPILPNIFAATDAVINPANGQIVCRSALSGVTPDCVPYNPFGVGTASKAALDYIFGTWLQRSTNDFDNFEATVRSELVDLPAGPLKVAFGAAYRHETDSETPNPLSYAFVNCTDIRGCPAALNGALGRYVQGSSSPWRGGFSVSDQFIELSIPVFANQKFAQDLTLNPAFRLIEYKSGTIGTWKVGVNYAPFTGLRLRATRSRDAREPAPWELFTQGPVGNSLNIIDKVSGASFFGQTITTGNPDLKPELADTLTVGAVYRPSWLPGFSVSADWYDINVKKAIFGVGGQFVYDECQGGDASSCALITQVAPNFLRINAPFRNLSAIKTRGLDLVANYSADVGPGSLSLSASANRLAKYTIQNGGGVPISYVGSVAPQSAFNVTTFPKWTGTFRASYALGPVSVTGDWQYIGKGVYNSTFVEGVNIDKNHVPAKIYTNLNIDWKIRAPSDGEFVAFLTVNNVFGVDPPNIPSPVTSAFQVVSSGYDLLGRYFTGGVRFKF